MLVALLCVCALGQTAETPETVVVASSKVAATLAFNASTNADVPYQMIFYASSPACRVNNAFTACTLRLKGAAKDKTSKIEYDPKKNEITFAETLPNGVYTLHVERMSGPTIFALQPRVSVAFVNAQGQDESRAFVAPMVRAAPALTRRPRSPTWPRSASGTS